MMLHLFNDHSGSETDFLTIVSATGFHRQAFPIIFPSVSVYFKNMYFFLRNRQTPVTFSTLSLRDVLGLNVRKIMFLCEIFS